MYRIYYDDGSTFDGAVESAPCDGVIVIVQDDPDVGRELLHIKDFYYWEFGRWWGSDLYGMMDYLRRPGWKKIVAGRNTFYANYADLYRRANEDPDFAPKTGSLLIEEPMR
jgi:hypothetical protein